jgi:hypothetical protein
MEKAIPKKLSEEWRVEYAKKGAAAAAAPCTNEERG